MRKHYHRGRRSTKKSKRDRRIQIACIVIVAIILSCFLALTIATFLYTDSTNVVEATYDEYYVEDLVIDTSESPDFSQNPKVEPLQPRIICEQCIKEIEEAELDEHMETHQPTTPYVEVSPEERYALATLIYLEGRGESVKCQYAIGSVILNRYTTGDYASLFDVIYEKGQFTPAYLIDETTPTDVQIGIAEELCFHGPTIPEYITYFRADRYHDWGNDFPVPYNYIDNTYFSYDSDIVVQCMEEAGVVFGTDVE